MALEKRLTLAADLGDRQEEMLRGDVFVAEPLRLGFGELDDAAGPRIHRQRTARDPGPPCQDGRELAAEPRQVSAEPAQRLGGDAVVGLDERGQDVLGVEDRAVQALGGGLGGDDGLLGLLGEAFELHGGSRFVSDQRGSGCLARSKNVRAAAVASSETPTGRMTRALT